MKHILKLGYNRYLHLDSYNENHETRGGNFFVNALVTLIMAVTIGAVIGVDVTQFNQPIQQQNNAKPQ
jgi:hypothetical protein